MPRRLLFPALLGALHLYIALRVLPDLPGGVPARLAGGVLLTVCFGLMILSLLARLIWPRPLADRVAVPGLFMAGLFSSLLVLTLLRDLTLGSALLFLPVTPFQRLQSISAVLVLGLGSFATVAGFASARRRARVVEIEVPVRDLPAQLHGFSIAQITDVHVGATIRRSYVERIVDAVNSLEPDMIALTGDFVDGPVLELATHTAPLQRLCARYGAFFVTGNHEYYSGAGAWTAEFRRLGLRVLLNEHAVINHNGAALVVAGVTDFSAHHFDPAQRSDPVAALAGAPADAALKILLAHQPRSAPAAARAGFHLQLSGHTHGGQFWPWNLFVRFQQPFTAGLHRLNALWVYVSRGTGYWGIPNRFGAPSEITRLRLVPAG
ncbi:MAG TPA: metallophosphoesterase [Steroidobacteraceae bacterium]|nr:metallophosphoesterase [Steroidobacteraceae bacterium]